jgi:predicted transport protein
MRPPRRSGAWGALIGRLGDGLADPATLAALQERLARHGAELSGQLPEAQLAEYWTSRSTPAAVYSLAGHPHLANAEIRAVFNALDLGIRALDPNVYQEVLKYYIAYKCETNFVDIVPQAKQLKLVLNMPFAEPDDPLKRALDVANIGTWGNGDVQITVTSLTDVPYALGLIRQSLERQLDDNPLPA